MWNAVWSKWTERDVPDQTGRVAVVTGGNGGLGLATVDALAAAGAHVVVAARDQVKTADALAGVRDRHPAASLEVVPLDLADLSSVRSAADRIRGDHDRIDLLVNNAGLMAMPERRTADGFEMQFGVNHLGHWALTALLMEPLLAADAARVVTVTSVAHHQGRQLDPANPHLRGTYSPWKAYGQSKLANFHFGIGLQRRFDAAGVRAASLIAHPGLSNTDLQRRTVREGGGGSSAPMWETLAARTGMSPTVGARPQLRAATDPGARGGQFYGPRFASFGPPVELPILRRWDLDSGIRILWDVSERETGIPLEVG
jgi:NAD(P)-dependent dehydrogenase (short-subunit alcohol dehydrogenase family)